jgi:hypothetical protein
MTIYGGGIGKDLEGGGRGLFEEPAMNLPGFTCKTTVAAQIRTGTFRIQVYSSERFHSSAVTGDVGQ